MAFTYTGIRRALIMGITTSLAVLGLVIAPSAPASAAAGPAYNVVDRPVTAVTGDPLPTVQIDGVVWDQAIAGDTVFAGGQFANARPAGSAAGTNLVPRENLLSFNIRTGVLNTGFAPDVAGRIRAMTLSPDNSRLYIVGSFLTVNGQPRNRIAAFNVSDGSLVPGFAPNVNDDIYTVVATKTAVYFGGTFGTVNGATRKKLAAVSPTTGATLGWAPTADSTVTSMTKTPDSSRIIVGGMFAKLNNSFAYGLGSLDAASGTLYPFAANNVIRDYGTSAAIYSLKSDATNIYGTGYWYGGSAGNFEGPFVLDPMTGAIKWMADCHGDTYDSSVTGTTLYSVSHHHDCTNIGGFGDTSPRTRWQRANAFTLAATTTVKKNSDTPKYFNFEGQPAPSIVNWFPEVPAGTFTGQGQGGWTSESTSEYLVQGGEFPRVSGKNGQGLVRFAIPALAPKKQGPVVSAADSAPTARSLTRDTVRVSWPANWDRDSRKLTYRLYRTSTTPTATALIKTVTDVESQFWNRPTQIFVDAGRTPGTTYGYYVEASDMNGNQVKSTTTTTTTGTAVVDASSYSKAVQADGASHYWRLDERSGTATSADWAEANDLVLDSGVALGSAGAIKSSADQAATFDGTSAGTAGQTSAEVGTSTFTTESWFTTTTTKGGKIVGFGNNQLGSSTKFDRHVYLDTTGHLTFGVCCQTGPVQTVTTPGTYNDGAWHQVVSSLSATGGMQLYVDGALQASKPSITTAQAYSGYWRVGGDNLASWPGTKTSNFLAGTVDDVSIYPIALTSTQIRAHYDAGVAANAAPVAAFTTSCTATSCAFDAMTSKDPDGSIASYAWDFGDSGKGTGDTNSHSYAAAGTYPVKLTVTDTAGATGTITKSVTVTAAPVSDVAAKDTFSRTGSPWGTADTGGTWTDAGATSFSSNGSKGILRLTKAGAGPVASLDSVSVQDGTTSVEFAADKVGTGGGSYLNLSARRIGTSEYRLTTRLMPDGSVRLATGAIVSGSEVGTLEIVVPNLSYAAGDVLKVSFTVSGDGDTKLSGKVWKASATEPSTAQVTSSNAETTLQAPGSVALQGYLSGSSTNAPVALTLDNFVVKRIN